MKVVTSMGLFDDSVGKRISISYSEVDDETGKIISDNKRIDRVVTKTYQEVLDNISVVEEFAQSIIDNEG